MNRIKKILYTISKGLNYDFCPSFNQYVYWLKQPIGWVVCGAGFSASVGFLIGPQGFVLMWSFIALLIVGCVWPWLSMKGLSCSLAFVENTSVEGEATKIRLEVTNRWPWPVYGMTLEGELLQDVVENDDKIVVALKRIPALSVSRFTWDYVPVKRGVLPKEAPIIATGFPFGIYHTSQPVDVSGQTVVHPKCTDLEGVPELEGTNFNIEGMMSDRSGHDGDTIGVRNFRQGDTLRNIHWAKTAAKSRLIVREKQTCAQQPIAVVLDLTPSSHEGHGSRSSYEWGIRIAASVCRHLHCHRSYVELFCLGLAAETKNKQTNRRGITALLNYLAELPELPALRVAIEGDESRISIRDLSDSKFFKTFIIKTNRSELPGESTNSFPIIMNTDGFVPDDQVNLEAYLDEAETNQREHSRTANSKDQILVSQVNNASDEFAMGWNQGVGCEL